MCTCHALMHIWFVGKGRIHVNHEQLGFHRFNLSSPAAGRRASSSPLAPPRGPRSGGGPTNPGPAAEARPIRLPAGPHWKASEGSAAKPRLTSRVSRVGGARSVLWTSGASQRPFSRADSIYSISVVRMILLTRPTSDLVKSLKQKTDR